MKSKSKLEKKPRMKNKSHQGEIWQVYSENGEPIEREGWDASLNNPETNNSDKIVGVAVVFLYRKNGDGEIELLWQKRADTIDRYPGDYDISAGGHINLGESVVEGAIRETKEEIGVDITADDLKFVTMRPFNKNRFAWVFAVDWTGKSDIFHFDDHEVSEVKWVLRSETDDFRKKYAKAPLKNDRLTFLCLDEWFLQHGDL